MIRFLILLMFTIELSQASTSHTVQGLRRAYFWEGGVHELCGIACDKASETAFKKAAKVCNQLTDGTSEVKPIHGECVEMKGVFLGCRGRYVLEFLCE